MKNAKVYEAEQTAVKDEQDNNGETYNSNKVTATGLKENKTYYYSYDNGNGYTKPAGKGTRFGNPGPGRNTRQNLQTISHLHL